MKSRPILEPITEATLPEFAAFLTTHLNPAISAATWEASFRKQWTATAPNYGFLLRDQTAIGGAIGAFYAERVIRDQTLRFCNISSWCVLDAYRSQSMRLAMAILAQEGWQFTDFSPTQVVAGTLRFLKFKPLDDRQAVVFNLPGGFLGGRVLDQPDAILAALKGPALAAYRDHAEFPWLNHLALGQATDFCHVIYKRRIFKGLPAAEILHFSDPALFERHLGRLRRYFLGRGIATTLVECRRLNQQPWPSKVRSGFNPKLYLSATLGDDDIDYLYSETMVLDL